jgi:hypothetical protein
MAEGFSNGMVFIVSSPNTFVEGGRTVVPAG